MIRYVALTSILWLASAPAWAQFAYIPNSVNHTVSVINTATNTVVTTINLPEPSRLPLGVAGNPSGTRIYITNTCESGFLSLSTCDFGETGTVSVINAITNTVIKTIPLPSEPAGIVVSPDGTRAYVVNSCSGSSCVFDPQLARGSISVIDVALGSPTENTVLGNIPLPGGSYPVGIAVNPIGSRIYVGGILADAGDGIVWVVDTASRSVLTTVLVPSFTIGIVINPVSSRLYVGSVTGDISVIDTTNNTLLKSVPLGFLLEMTIKPDGSRLYAASPSGVFVVNTTNDNLDTVATISPAGIFPFGVAAHPDGSRVYVTDFEGGNVLVINTATNTVSGNPIGVGQGPSGLGQFIPSASAGSIAALISLLESFDVQTGTVSSLEAKLKNILASLTAPNAAQRQDAINKLNAFINEVEAQRGKAFTNSQADQLELMANQIIAGLQNNPAPNQVQSPISVAPAPAGVPAIQGLIQVVTNLNKKQGIDNATDAKLQDAQAALAAAQAGQRQNAVAQLQAFITATNAQRGSKLNPAQANLLVKMASEIIALL